MEQKPKQTRNAAVTRETILNAARTAFTKRGYEAVGVRQIAAMAGVNASLINRYFGSKEGLFVETLEDGFSLEEFIAGERAQFGERLARHIVTKSRSRPDSIVALIRAASGPKTAKIVKQGISQTITQPLASWLGGPDAQERAGCITSLMMGFLLSGTILGAGNLRAADDELLIRLLASGFQHFVDASDQRQTRAAGPKRKTS